MGLIGGALKKNMDKLVPSYNFIHVFLLMLTFILIKMVLVKYCYNEVVPRIMKDDKVYKLTYTDSLLLVILVSSLI
tara:strand:+ start:386 stop:613 length:228 start_codon:yes stop_codon:yes gene_type:complete